MRLSKAQKQLFADKLLDLAHFIATGLVIGQFISDNPFSIELAISGLLLFAFLYWLSYYLTK